MSVNVVTNDHVTSMIGRDNISVMIWYGMRNYKSNFFPLLQRVLHP